MNTMETSNSRMEAIRLVLKDLLKVIKVVALYPEDNPLPQSLRQSFGERLVDVVGDYGPIHLDVERERILVDGETVFVDRSKEESLGGLLFDVGIIRFILKRGLDYDEVLRLLDVFKVYQNSNRRESDLVALLWEAGLRNISYETVEDIKLEKYGSDFMTQEVIDGTASRTGRLQMASDKQESYNAIFELGRSDGDSDISRDSSHGRGEDAYEVVALGNDSGEIVTGSLFDSGDEPSGQPFMIAEAVEAMGFSDLNANVPRMPDLNLILSDEHKLSTEELEEAASLLAGDNDFDIWESISELVKEILHQEPELSEFNESVTIGEKVIVELIQAGRLTYAAEILRYFQTLEDGLRAKKPLWSERLKEGRITLAARERLRILGETLNQNDDIGAVELQRYLDNFTWESLMNITDLIGDLSHQHHRDTVRDYLVRRGRDNVRIIARGLHDKRVEVVTASIHVLAQVADREALAALKGVARHDTPEVRQHLAEALRDSPSDDVLDILRALASDTDSAVRRAAVAGIVKHRGRPAFETIADIIDDPQFAALDPDDRQLLLNAYSTLGGDMAVEFLVSMAGRRSLLGRDEAAYYRQAALEALSHNRGELAEKALLKLSSSWHGDTKAAARQALQRRRELIYGDGHE